MNSSRLNIFFFYIYHIKSQLRRCTPVPKTLVHVQTHHHGRGCPERTQCQFSAHRHRVRNYLDKPLGVTITTSSPPPARCLLSLGLCEFIARHYANGWDKNVLLIYLVKGLKDERVREVIIPKLATLSD